MASVGRPTGRPTGFAAGSSSGAAARSWAGAASDRRPIGAAPLHAAKEGALLGGPASEPGAPAVHVPGSLSITSWPIASLSGVCRAHAVYEAVGKGLSDRGY
jgi:hypothetical protein